MRDVRNVQRGVLQTTIEQTFLEPVQEFMTVGVGNKSLAMLLQVGSKKLYDTIMVTSLWLCDCVGRSRTYCIVIYDNLFFAMD